MSISTKFETFNNDIRITSTNVEKIRRRYKQITKRLNLDFWDSDSETSHSIYVGSYGRDTDVNVSDVGIKLDTDFNLEQNSQTFYIKKRKS